MDGGEGGGLKRIGWGGCKQLASCRAMPTRETTARRVLKTGTDVFEEYKVMNLMCET
jgi:hypothetical protein